MNDFFYVPLFDYYWGEVTYHAVPVRIGRTLPGIKATRLDKWMTLKTGFD